MTTDRTSEVYSEISRSGYYPDIVADGLRDAVADETVLAYVLHHEPTFDRDEIRRHMTVLALTPTRVILVHTDEHPPDDLLPHPYTSTTSEAVAVCAGSFGGRVTDGVCLHRQARGGGPHRRVGCRSRVDLEPAHCDDPDCDADHGFTGSITGDDFSLRLSATADGGAAVGRLLEFARHLSAATTDSARA